MKKIFCYAVASLGTLFTAAQNVGIGTDSPSRARLEVHGAVGATAAIFGGESTGISLLRNWLTVGFNEYYNNGHRYMAGGFAAQQYLNPANGIMAIEFFGSGSKDAPAANPKRAIAFTAEGQTILGDGTGRLLINRNAPTNYSTAATLEINQHWGRGLGLIDPLSGYHWQLSTVVGSPPFLELAYNGALKGLFKSATGEYVYFSDKRLKQAVQPLAPLLQKLMRLQPVSYEAREQNPVHERSIGFLAQDVKKLFPELVTVIPDSSHGYKGLSGLHALNYAAFGVLAVKAVQEQQVLIEQQRQALQKQQQKIEELSFKVNALFRQINSSPRSL